MLPVSWGLSAVTVQYIPVPCGDRTPVLGLEFHAAGMSDRLLDRP